MGDRKTYLINQIAKYSQKLDEKGFGANHDGNISALFEDTILATPTAVSKGNVDADMIITLDRQGKKIAGIGQSFSEIKLHLAAYNARSEAQAVVHAHPPFAMAFGLVNRSLYPAIPEAIVSIGDVIPVVPFAMPGVPENDAIIADALAQVDVFIMPGNGVLAIGDSVEQAYLRLELVEHIAKMQYYAEQLGRAHGVSPMQLSAENLDVLLQKRAVLGLGPKHTDKAAQAFNASSENTTNKNKDADLIATLKKLIADEIKKIL
jgi:L-fuculose-phosphate aldolase